MEKFKKALVTLGIKGHVTVSRNDCFSCQVFIDGNYFGIWDHVKCNFVA